MSTIGRVDAFRRLMHSLENSSAVDRLQVILVDQSEDQRCVAVLTEQPWRLRWQSTTSSRGASVGRNVGLRLVTAPVVAFPDDDAWYPVDTLDRAIEAFAADTRLTALCGRQVTASGHSSMLRWKRTPCLITPYNFMRTSIMSTMFFRRSWLDTHDHFDENMGVGSAGWYGACEESDLLLRVIEDGHDVPYDPSLLVLQDEPREHPDESFVAKMLSYGCGQGHLWRKRSLPMSLFVWYLARKLVAGSVRASRGERVLARADLAWLRGNVAGLRDVPPKELRHRADVR